MSDDLENTILTNANGPKRAKGDSSEVEQHSLSDQIALDKHLNSKKAAKKKGLGIKMSKTIPPGTV